MNIDKWFSHWGIAENPFKDEEAKDDDVFQRVIGEVNTHSDFEKVYGSPDRPSTSIVFGEKGSGKTALRMLITRRIEDYNKAHLGRRVFVVEYDDWNAFLDRFTQKVKVKPVEAALRYFRLWDHLDGILSTAVTSLVDYLVDGQPFPATPFDETEHAELIRRLRRLPRPVKRDFCLLVALYDSGTKTSFEDRFHHVRKMLGLRGEWKLKVAAVVLAALAGLSIWKLGFPYGLYGAIGAAAVFGMIWLVDHFRLWRLASKTLRDVFVVGRSKRAFLRALKKMKRKDLLNQPFPNTESADARYQLLSKLQAILQQFGFASIVVLVDRVDEPHLVHGDPQIMRSLVWPLLDNKFLKFPGVGVKLFLPIELGELIRREDRHFFERTRLDKQNLVFPLRWSGPTLYDIANTRLGACLQEGASPVSLKDLFEEDVREDDIVDALEQMRQPRDAFKFLYNLIKEHCRLYTDESGQPKISKLLLREVVKQERDRVEAFKAGWSHG